MMDKIAHAVLAVLITVLPASASWQTDLESVFPYVFTFDNLQDWTGSIARTGAAKSYVPSDLPKTIDGNLTRIVGYQYEGPAGTQNGPWIGNHGEYSLGDKSARLSFSRTFGGDTQVDARMGSQDILFYFGNGNEPSGTKDDGYDVVHIFYRMKFSRNDDDLTADPYSWLPSGTNNEYYLVKSGGNPGLLMPNHVIINGTWVADPIAYEIGKYTDRGNNIGILADNAWAYGDTNSLGFETIYIKLADGTDPDTKGAGFVKYESGFFVMQSDGRVQYTGTIKHLLVSQGFWYDSTTLPYLQNQDANGGNSCDGTPSDFYGTNFTIFNWRAQSDYTDLVITDNQGQASIPNWGVLSGCYGYLGGVGDYKNYGDNSGIDNIYLNKQWLGIEYILDKGVCGTPTGSITIKFYNEAGVEIGNESRTNLLLCDTGSAGPDVLDSPYNKINIGGNRFGSGYSYDYTDSWDNRYYLDDLIISGTEIAPTYFSMLAGNPPPEPACTDGTQNGDETGIDCGGSCPSCDDPTPIGNSWKSHGFNIGTTPVRFATE